MPGINPHRMTGRRPAGEPRSTAYYGAQKKAEEQSWQDDAAPDDAENENEDYVYAPVERFMLYLAGQDAKRRGAE